MLAASAASMRPPRTVTSHIANPVPALSWQSGPASDAVTAIRVDPRLATASVPPRSPALAPHDMNVAPSRLSRTPHARPAAWNNPTSSSAQRCIQTMPWKNVNAVSHRDFPGSNHPFAPTDPPRNEYQTAHAYHAPKPHARSAGSLSDNGPSAPAAPIANTGATTQTSSRCPRDIRGFDSFPSTSRPARRGIVHDMASRTGAAATAPRPTPSLSSASPLSTLAHSAIASARATNDDDDDTAGGDSLFPGRSVQNFCYVVVDPRKRHATVWYHAYRPYW
mmetsp:Transcript_3863/g.15712  ORF Transcript_3863/g.15712 Transcript_3863/m.15712 type:complete len:278 (+) Transcript_3863:1746-2579(+)